MKNFRRKCSLRATHMCSKNSKNGVAYPSLVALPSPSHFEVAQPIERLAPQAIEALAKCACWALGLSTLSLFLFYMLSTLRW